MIDFDGIFAIIKMQTTKTRQRTLKTVRDGAQRRKQPMLAEERFGQILDLLNKQRTATVQELCEALGTSESTIRRDLTELDRLGKLNKVHGGATLPDNRFQAEEPTMQAKETLAVPQKRAIAAAAAALIHAEDFVFIDAGSTTLELVRALEGEALQANYVTNGVAHARTLAQKGCRVFLPGGLLRPQTEAIVGAAAVSSLQQYNFTKAFMGANGVALEAGFTTPDPEEAAVKATVVHRARESWFLVDDAKFARICPAVIADLHSGAILTNRCPNPKYKQYTLVKETEL
jgi:DeoR family fructose operon transcriptional repressor